MSFSFTAPNKRRKRTLNGVAQAGKYEGTVDAVAQEIGPPQGFTITWRFRAPTVYPSSQEVGNKRLWKLETLYDAKEFGDVIVDLGLSGREIGPDDIIGATALVCVRTLGQRRSAKVVDVEPLPGDD